MSRCESPTHDRVRLSSAEVRALAVIADAEDGPLDALGGIPCRAGRLVARLRGLARRSGALVATAGWGRVAVLGSAVVLGAVVPFVLAIGIGIVVALAGVGVAAQDHVRTHGGMAAARSWWRSSRRGEG